MMLVPLILILQCLHTDTLEEQLFTDSSRSTGQDSNLKAVLFSLEQSLGYGKSHVLLKGPQRDSTLLDAQKEDNHLKSTDLKSVRLNLEQSLGYSKSRVLQQGPKLQKILNASTNKLPILNPKEEKNSILLDPHNDDNNLKFFDLKAEGFSLEQSLGYSKSHVLLQGPKLQKILNPSINKRSTLSSKEEEKSTLLDLQKKGDDLKYDILSQNNYDTELNNNHAHLLSKIPSSILSTLSNSNLKTEDTNGSTSDGLDQPFEHANNISFPRKHKERIVNERSLSIQKSKPLKDSPNWPSSSYASASSWAGGYGRPSAGGTTANAQASATAGESSASSSSGSSSGSVHNGEYYGGGSGSNAGSISQSTSGFGSETNGGSAASSNSGAYFNNYYKPTGPIVGGGSSGHFVGSNSLTGLGTLGGSMTSLNPGINSGSTSSSGNGVYYFRPSSPNTGASLSGTGGSGGSFTQNSGGYNSQILGSISGTHGTGSSSGGSIGYQGSYHRPTGSTAAYSAGSGGYQGSSNKPSSGSYSGSISSAGAGGYNKPTSSTTGNYSPYNRPTNSVSYNYNKPNSNSGASTTSSTGYGGYYGNYNKPTSLPASENHQNINNKPVSGTTSRPAGAYYNGYYITTLPNSGPNMDGISINMPSSGGSKPLTGIDTATSSFSGSTSGSSSGIGIISGPIINSGTSFNSVGSVGPVFHIPWWLEAGVFSSASITGFPQGVNSGSGISNNLISGINNFGSGLPIVFGTGGVTSLSTSGAGSQGSGSSSEPILGVGSTSGQIVQSGISSNLIPGSNNAGVGSSMVLGSGGIIVAPTSETGSHGGKPPFGTISGAGSASSSLVGSDIHGVGLPTGSLVGTDTAGVATSGHQTHEGGGSAGVINNNLGSISISGTENLLNSSSISPAGLGSTSGSLQGPDSSSGAIMGSIHPVNNPILIPEVTTIASLINSGISLTLPWWFLTGVFSGSIDHSQTGSTGVVGIAELAGLTSAGSSSGSNVIPGWSGTVTGSGLEPGNHFGSTPSGGNITLQPLQSLQSNAETSIGVWSNLNNGPTSSTGVHSENQTLGNMPSGSQTGEIASSSHPEISSGNNFDSSSGLIIVPGSLPISLGSSQVEGSLSSSQSGSSPLISLSGGSGDHTIGDLVNSSHHKPAGNLPGSSGLATSTTTQDNTPTGSQLEQSQTGVIAQQVRPSVENIQVGIQPGAFPEIIFPSNSRPGFPSVSDIAISSRPHGWSGGDNGPASLIGFQSRPSSGSLAETGHFSSSGASTNNFHLPYKVSEEETADTGTVSVSQHPWWLVADENSPTSESSKRYHTAFSDKPASGSVKDLRIEISNKSKDNVPVTSIIHGKLLKKKSHIIEDHLLKKGWLRSNEEWTTSNYNTN